jgi:hypothetical protein
VGKEYAANETAFCARFSCRLRGMTNSFLDDNGELLILMTKKEKRT